MDLPHRTLLAVIPSTKSQTPPLWEDKPPCPFGRRVVTEIRKVSLAIASCPLRLPSCFIGSVHTVSPLSRLYLLFVDDHLRLYLSSWHASLYHHSLTRRPFLDERPATLPFMYPPKPLAKRHLFGTRLIFVFPAIPQGGYGSHDNGPRLLVCARRH